MDDGTVIAHEFSSNISSIHFILFQFQSHQIFHVFVVLAAIVHLIGMVEIAHFRSQNKHCIASASVLQWTTGSAIVAIVILIFSVFGCDLCHHI